MMNTLLRAACALGAAAFTAAAVTTAQACACCTSPAWRYVEVEPLKAARLAQIEQVVFDTSAKLMLGEANEVGIKGVQDAEETYQLAVTRQKDRVVFTFRDQRGRAGTLALAIPKTISVFEVDPRVEDKDGGLGPSLYKEWKLTADAAGDGLFRGVVGGRQKITLVLHGRGIGCTDASHFDAWTLLIHGPALTVTMYGRLVKS